MKQHLHLRIAIILLTAFTTTTLISSQTFAQTPEKETISALFGKSYKATQKIPKKIFAKALAVSLKIAVPKQKSCFKDSKKAGINAIYICALKQAKIFTGTKKASFKPDSKTTWDNVVKSLCRAKKWSKKITYSACLTKMDGLGLLSAPLSKKVSSKTLITYKDLLAILTRLNAADQPTVTPVTPSQPQPEPLTPEPEVEFSLTVPLLAETPLTFTPVSSKEIKTDFFAHINLSVSLPNTFYKNEVYFVEGDFSGTTAEEAFVFICRDGQTCDDSMNFIEDTTANGTHFKIPVHFEETGNFQIGIMPGRSGESKIENISVLPKPSEITGGRSPLDLKSEYKQGKAVFSWSGIANLTRLTFFQGTKRQDYIFRQNINTFEPDSADFSKFEKGPAAWFVTADTAQSEIKKISLTVQEFRKVEPKEIQVNSMQEVFTSPGRFTFSGKSLAPIAKNAAFTLPNGEVKEFDIAQEDLPANQNITREENLDTQGTYIFEINNPQGSAVINVPIYVGTALPLLPDYYSLHPPVLDTTPITDIGQARLKLLSLINKDRAAHGLPPVAISNGLNLIAQAHSQNMVNLNFFGHVNPAGESPDDRRIKANYPASIRENLAKATTLDGVEMGLMRSPVHRAAIIDPDMTRVGIGIAKNSEGYIFATQNFSAEPITASDLPELENSLFAQALDKRSSLNLPSLSHDTALREIAKQWSENMQSQNFFGVTDSTGNTLLGTVREHGITSGIQAHILQSSEKSSLKEELLTQAGLLNAENSKIGIGLGVNSIGEVYMTVLYTP